MAGYAVRVAYGLLVVLRIPQHPSEEPGGLREIGGRIGFGIAEEMCVLFRHIVAEQTRKRVPDRDRAHSVEYCVVERGLDAASLHDVESRQRCPGFERLRDPVGRSVGFGDLRDRIEYETGFPAFDGYPLAQYRMYIHKGPQNFPDLRNGGTFGYGIFRGYHIVGGRLAAFDIQEDVEGSPGQRASRLQGIEAVCGPLFLYGGLYRAGYTQCQEVVCTYGETVLPAVLRGPHRTEGIPAEPDEVVLCTHTVQSERHAELFAYRLLLRGPRFEIVLPVLHNLGIGEERAVDLTVPVLGQGIHAYYRRGDHVRRQSAAEPVADLLLADGTLVIEA